MMLCRLFWMSSLLWSMLAFGHSFVEPNDKDQYDEIERFGAADEAVFKQTIAVIQTSYQTYTQEKNLKPLRIGGFWSDSTVNAYFTPQLQTNIVTVYGGLARRPELTADGLALVVCHEVGHAYGGRPDKASPVFRVSVEGQADYYGAGSCLERVLDQLPEPSPEPVPAAIRGFCNNSPLGAARCERMLLAAASVGRLLSFIKSEPVPDFETPDLTVVNATLQSYPARIQCRLDTYLRSILGQTRPACWYRG